MMLTINTQNAFRLNAYNILIHNQRTMEHFLEQKRRFIHFAYLNNVLDCVK